MNFSSSWICQWPELARWRHLWWNCYSGEHASHLSLLDISPWSVMWKTVLKYSGTSIKGKKHLRQQPIRIQESRCIRDGIALNLPVLHRIDCVGITWYKIASVSVHTEKMRVTSEKFHVIPLEGVAYLLFIMFCWKLTLFVKREEETFQSPFPVCMH